MSYRSICPGQTHHAWKLAKVHHTHQRKKKNVSGRNINYPLLSQGLGCGTERGTACTLKAIDQQGLLVLRITKEILNVVVEVK